MLLVLLLCCSVGFLIPVSQSVDFQNAQVRAAFLQQFGYMQTTEEVPVGINELDDMVVRKMSDEDGPDMMTIIPEDAVKQLQKYAGVEETGVFDDETIGMMITPRCQNPDIMNERSTLTRFFLGSDDNMNKKATGRDRIKRNAGWSAPKWDKVELTFAFENTTPQNSRAREIISSAFDAWGECSKLVFSRVEMSGSPDIEIRFVRQLHAPPAGCAFDGPDGVKAHAFYPPLGKAHFDEDEDWSDDCVLYSVALHEIGHLLGLGHSFHRTSIMFAYFDTGYVKSMCQDSLTRPLAQTDIDNVRSLYGSSSCDKAADPEATTEPPLPVQGASTGPGALDEYSTSAEPTSETSTPTEQLNTSNTPSGSAYATFATKSNWRLRCGGISDNILSSPYYPEVYPNGMNCTWTVVVPEGMIAVTAHFIAFELEAGGDECMFDYLKMWGEHGDSDDTHTDTVKLCGIHTESIMWETDTLHINFVSDSLRQYRGFRILFVYHAEAPKTPCRMTVSEEEGILTEVHPEWDDHDECVFVLNATDPSKRIMVLPDKSACGTYQLFQSESDGAIDYAQDCSTSRSRNSFVGPVFFLKFNPRDGENFTVRYYTVSADGWKGCNDEEAYDYNDKFIESGVWSPAMIRHNPGRWGEHWTYKNHTDCILYIPRDAKGRELKVEIFDLDIEEDKYCSYDFLEIHITEDSYSKQQQPIRLCGTNNTVTEFVTATDVLLYFHSDESVEGSGVTVSYSVNTCVYEIPRGIYTTTIEPRCDYQYSLESGDDGNPPVYFACFDFQERVDESTCAGHMAVTRAPSALPRRRHKHKNHHKDKQYDDDQDDYGLNTERYCNSFSTIMQLGTGVKVRGSLSPGISMTSTPISTVGTCYKKVTVSSSLHTISMKPPRNRRCLLHIRTVDPTATLRIHFSSVNLRRKPKCVLEYVRLYQNNQGCGDSTKICRSQYVDVNSNEAFIMSYMVDRKSSYKVRISQEFYSYSGYSSQSSHCTESCEDYPGTESPTLMVGTESSTPTPIIQATTSEEGIGSLGGY